MITYAHLILTTLAIWTGSGDHATTQWLLDKAGEPRLGIYRVERNSKYAIATHAIGIHGNQITRVNYYSNGHKLENHVDLPDNFELAGIGSNGAIYVKANDLFVLRNGKLRIVEKVPVGSSVEVIDDQFLMSLSGRKLFWGVNRDGTVIENVLPDTPRDYCPTTRALAVIHRSSNQSVLSTYKVHTKSHDVPIRTRDGNSAQLFTEECSMQFIDSENVVVYLDTSGFSANEINDALHIDLQKVVRNTYSYPYKIDNFVLASINTKSGIATPLLTFSKRRYLIGSNIDGHIGLSTSCKNNSPSVLISSEGFPIDHQIASISKRGGVILTIEDCPPLLVNIGYSSPSRKHAH